MSERGSCWLGSSCFDWWGHVVKKLLSQAVPLTPSSVWWRSSTVLGTVALFFLNWCGEWLSLPAWFATSSNLAGYLNIWVLIRSLCYKIHLLISGRTDKLAQHKLISASNLLWTQMRCRSAQTLWHWRTCSFSARTSRPYSQTRSLSGCFLLWQTHTCLNCVGCTWIWFFMISSMKKG